MRRAALTPRQLYGAPDRFRSENKKFQVGPNPLERERELDMIQPQTAQQQKRMVEIMEKLCEDMGNTPAHRNALEMWRVQLLGADADAAVKADFARRFQFWLLGRGTPEDTAKTFWGRGNLAAHNPEIAAYIDQFLEARANYAMQLALLANRAPTSLLGAYLYFKYITNGKLKQTTENGQTWWHLDQSDFLEDFDLFRKYFNTVPTADGRHRPATEDDQYSKLVQPQQFRTQKDPGAPANAGQEPYPITSKQKEKWALDSDGDAKGPLAVLEADTTGPLDDSKPFVNKKPRGRSRRTPSVDALEVPDATTDKAPPNTPAPNTSDDTRIGSYGLTPEFLREQFDAERKIHMDSLAEMFRRFARNDASAIETTGGLDTTTAQTAEKLAKVRARRQELIQAGEKPPAMEPLDGDDKGKEEMSEPPLTPTVIIPDVTHTTPKDMTLNTTLEMPEMSETAETMALEMSSVVLDDAATKLKVAEEATQLALRARKMEEESRRAGELFVEHVNSLSKVKDTPTDEAKAAALAARNAKINHGNDVYREASSKTDDPELRDLTQSRANATRDFHKEVTEEAATVDVETFAQLLADRNVQYDKLRKRDLNELEQGKPARQRADAFVEQLTKDLAAIRIIKNDATAGKMESLVLKAENTQQKLLKLTNKLAKADRLHKKPEGE